MFQTVYANIPIKNEFFLLAWPRFSWRCEREPILHQDAQSELEGTPRTGYTLPGVRDEQTGAWAGS